MKRTLRLILFSYAILFLGGVTDILSFVIPDRLADYSSITLGVLAMGVIGTFIATDKMLHFYEDPWRSLLKIAEIHDAMEAQRPLGNWGVPPRASAKKLSSPSFPHSGGPFPCRVSARLAI